MSSSAETPQFFWMLDNQTPPDVIKEYRSALEGKELSRLRAWVKLIDARVPILPRAYLSSSVSEMGGVNEVFTYQLGQTISHFERAMHGSFSGERDPLLITLEGDYCGSIRNIGVSPRTVRGLMHHYGSGPAFALYVDFLESFSSLVLGCPHLDFRKTFDLKSDREGGAGGFSDLGEQEFLEYVSKFQNLVSQKIHKKFPESPERQLLQCLLRFTTLSKEMGDEIFMSVQIHPSVYGRSIQGVAYTRNPFTGGQDVYGVYQGGQDAKKRPLTGLAKGEAKESLQELQGDTFALIKMHLPAIESTFREVVEATFITDEDGHLYFTGFDKAQTTARATALSAVELCRNGILSEREAALQIPPNDVEILLHPTLDEQSRVSLEKLEASGVAASYGTAVGHVFFKMSDAIEFHQKASRGSRVILISEELLISDSPGISILSGLATRAGGIASHAAVMARANGIPCIVGCKNFEFDPTGKTMKVGPKIIKSGSLITLEAGGEGQIFLGEGKLENLSFQQGVVKDVARLISSVIQQEKIPLSIYANINNAKEAEAGIVFGVEGVGLCRTENMFMEDNALSHVREIVFSENPNECKDSFKALEEIQFEDFRKIFHVLQGRPINIRLMDLPLHEFAPHGEKDWEKVLAELKHLDKARLRTNIEKLVEHNPMLGLRACRFGLMVPAVYDMQIRAILRAGYDVMEKGLEIDPGIMFPMVMTAAELSELRDRVIAIAEEVREELKVPFGKRVKVRIGTMVEVPVAALGTDQLAKQGEFFAFGTNDLTQTTFGISRDDSARFLPFYLENGYLPEDPFKVLSEPVKELLRLSIQRGRRVRPDATFGICGEQGGDRSTLEFCLENNVQYVSCSPFRVLPTRVALVHVALARGKGTTEPSAVRQSRKGTGREHPMQNQRS
jgi:pyruvate, orthophosphate dikinase